MHCLHDLKSFCKLYGLWTLVEAYKSSRDLKDNGPFNPSFALRYNNLDMTINGKAVLVKESIERMYNDTFSKYIEIPEDVSVRELYPEHIALVITDKELMMKFLAVLSQSETEPTKTTKDGIVTDSYKSPELHITVQGPEDEVKEFLKDEKEELVCRLRVKLFDHILESLAKNNPDSELADVLSSSRSI